MTESCRSWFAFLAVAAFAGCGSGEPRPDVLRTVPVEGTLTYQGQPLESFQVVFSSVDGKQRPATGRTDASGKFTLGINRAGDGAPVGSYKVSVAFDPEIDSLTATPIENTSQMPKPKVKVPDKYSNPEKSGLTQDIPSGGIKDLKLDLK